MTRKSAHRKSRLFVWSKWLAGLVLILLLTIPSDAGFVSATADSGSGPTGDGLALAPAADGGWLRIRMNLSGSPSIVSGYPDIAISDDDNYVAVVWTEGYNTSTGAKHHGRVYLRWISENNGVWSSKITVNQGEGPSENDWATDAALALQGTKAHIVWVRVQNSNRYSIRYRTCTLGGACDAPRELESEYNSAFASPDIAVDGSGNVFIVWSREALPYREIRFQQFYNSTWSSVERISDNNTVNDWPVVAVMQGKVYTAWITTAGAQAPVAYRAKSASGAWTDPTAYFLTGLSSQYPRLMTDGNTVYLVWQTFQTGSDYQIGYKYNTGSGWQPGGSSVRKFITSDTDKYSASTSGDEYLQYLRPAVALDNSGHLHAVWHHYDSGETGTLLHRVLYSRSDNPTAATPTWTASKVYAELSGDEDFTPEQRHFLTKNVSARIVVGRPRLAGEQPHVHVVLMVKTGSAWDVWYLSNQTYRNFALPMVSKNY